MSTFFSVLLIAAALPLFALSSLSQKPVMIQSALFGSRRSIQFANVGRASFSCFISNSPHGFLLSSQSQDVKKPHIKSCTANPLLQSDHQIYATFHTSTMLMMGSERKRKNGGRSKKVKIEGLSKTAAKKLAKLAVESMDEEEIPDHEGLSLSDLFESESSKVADTNESTVASTEFATEYHAPVMPTECVQALLKKGTWAELLADKKRRWRKKRSITEAKMRRLGQLVDEQIEEDNQKDYTEVNEEDTSSDTNRPRLFIDGTLGGGGHSQAILEQLSPGDILIGCDVDPEALSTASNRLLQYLGTTEYILDRHDDTIQCGWEEGKPMFIPVQSNFRNLISVLSKVRHPVTSKLLLGDREPLAEQNQILQEKDDVEFPFGANGMLLDLGVSSHQIDTPDRGFAFMKDGPLDMRMSGNSLITAGTKHCSSLTAADICNEFDEPSLISILQTFGDEPRARRIAGAIVASRPLYSTTDLVHAINSVTPTFARQKRAGLIATSARVFQALRIAVNEEDGALRDVLEKVAPWVLSSSGGMMKAGDVEAGKEGMLVVLSYHSMEDKMAKRVMRDGSIDFLDSPRGKGGALNRDVFGNMIGQEGSHGGDQLPFEPLGKPQKATDEEITTNSRARSATLRVAIRN